jgi:1-acyl-sn-glycerol-3-phosphate acyltransferase
MTRMTRETAPRETPGPAAAEAAAPRRAGNGTVRPPREPIPFKFAQTLCRVFTSLYFDLKVWGIEHVPRTGGVLLVSNHQSFLDPILLGVRLPRSLSYMAKSELFEVNPVFTWLIRSLGAFPVRQTGSAAGAIKESVERLQEGHALNIFPEGARTETGEIGPIEKGVVLVIRRAKVPVVPVAIHGSFEAWPKGAKRSHAHPIRMAYGPAMDLADLKPDEIVARIDRTLREMYDGLRARRREEVWATGG